MLADLEKGSMFPASRFEARQFFGGVTSGGGVGGGGCAAGTPYVAPRKVNKSNQPVQSSLQCQCQHPPSAPTSSAHPHS